MNCILGDWWWGVSPAHSPTPNCGMLLFLLLGRGPLQRGLGLGSRAGVSFCSSHCNPCGVIHNTACTAGIKGTHR